MSKENLFENPANPSSSKDGVGQTNNHDDEIVDVAKNGENRGEDDYKDEKGDYGDFSATGNIEKLPSEEELYGKAKRKKQRNERELMFGKFVAEIGWRTILSIALYVFAISVVVCTFIILTFVKGRDAPVQTPIMYDEPDPVIEMAKKMFADLNKELDEMEVRIINKRDRVVKAINEQSKAIIKKMSGKRVVEKVKHVKNNIVQRLEEKNEIFKTQFQNHKIAILEQAKQHRIKTFDAIANLDNYIMTSFSKQDMKIEESISDLTVLLMNITAVQEKRLRKRLQSVMDSVNEGLKYYSANYSADVSAFYDNIENTTGNFVADISHGIENEAKKMKGDNEDKKTVLEIEVENVENALQLKKQGQNKQIEDLIEGYLYDVLNVTNEHASNLEECIPDKINNRKQEILNKITILSNGVEAYKTDIVKFATDSSKNGLKKIESILKGHYDAYEERMKEITKKYEEADKNLFDTATKSFTEVNKREEPQSCDEVHYKNALSWSTNKEGAFYKINFPLSKSENVYCSVEKGWLVLMRYVKDPSPFPLTLETYKTQIGSPVDGNFWAGLELMHEITSNGNYKVRIKVTDKESGTVFNHVYKSFTIGPSDSNFELKIGPIIPEESLPPLENADFEGHNGASFAATGMCAMKGGAGWWYYTGTKNGFDCFQVKLIGKNMYEDKSARSSDKDDISVGDGLWSTAEMSIKLM